MKKRVLVTLPLVGEVTVSSLILGVGIGIPVALGYLGIQYRIRNSQLESHLLHQQLPSLSFQTLERRMISTDEDHSSFKIINLWASWCPPCRAELPVFQELYEKYGDKASFYMVSSGESQEEVKHFLEGNKQLTLPVYLDLDGSAYATLSDDSSFIRKLSFKGGIPLTVVARGREVVYTHIGMIVKEDLERFLTGD